MNTITAAITAVGGYVPDFVLSNKVLETMVDTNDEWITSRTGIQERRILKGEGLGTPDMLVASTAVFVATQIGAVNAFAYDLQAACSGFLYGMSNAAAYVQSGRYKKVLLIGADKMSSIIDYTDRATCIIFGDGAGAALFEPNYEGLGLQDEILRSDGIGREYLKIDAGGSILPTSKETVENGQHYVFQDGKTVFKRIIDATASRMELDEDKVLVNIHKYGNTTAATLPLLLSDFENKFKKGDNLIFAAFGGGFTWGSIYLKWAYNKQ